MVGKNPKKENVLCSEYEILQLENRSLIMKNDILAKNYAEAEITIAKMQSEMDIMHKEIFHLKTEKNRISRILRTVYNLVLQLAPIVNGVEDIITSEIPNIETCAILQLENRSLIMKNDILAKDNAEAEITIAKMQSEMDIMHKEIFHLKTEKNRISRILRTVYNLVLQLAPVNGVMYSMESVEDIITSEIPNIETCAILKLENRSLIMKNDILAKNNAEAEITIAKMQSEMDIMHKEIFHLKTEKNRISRILRTVYNLVLQMAH